MPKDDGARYPFQAPTSELEANIEGFVTSTVASLSSFYLELPRGENFLEFDPFRLAYEELRAATINFKSLDPAVVWEAVSRNGLVLVVLRCILGLTPPE